MALPSDRVLRLLQVVFLAHLAAVGLCALAVKLAAAPRVGAQAAPPADARTTAPVAWGIAALAAAAIPLARRRMLRPAAIAGEAEDAAALRALARLLRAYTTSWSLAVAMAAAGGVHATLIRSAGALLPFAAVSLGGLALCAPRRARVRVDLARILSSAAAPRLP